MADPSVLHSSPAENPYAAPATDANFANGPANTNADYYVDGKLLVVRNGAVLPLRCMRTNEPATEADRFRKSLTRAFLPVLGVGLWLGLQLVLGGSVAIGVVTGLGLIPVWIYASRKQSCTATWYVQRRLQSRSRLLFEISLTAMAVFAILFFSMVSSVGMSLVQAGSIPTLMLLTYAKMDFYGIAIQKQEGDRFWIAGCSADFLNEISTEQARSRG